jgi:hypothetical protein
MGAYHLGVFRNKDAGHDLKKLPCPGCTPFIHLELEHLPAA